MLATLIRTRMQALGIKQRRLAALSEISTAQISMMLSGQVFNLTAETAGKLARVLEVPPEQVFAAALADVNAAQQNAALVAAQPLEVPAAIAG